MCRWFCLVSEEHGLLDDMLVRPKHSLIKQSAFIAFPLTPVDDHYLPDLHLQFQASDDASSPNVNTNVDGYGVAYWTTAASYFTPSDGLGASAGAASAGAASAGAASAGAASAGAASTSASSFPLFPTSTAQAVITPAATAVRPSPPQPSQTHHTYRDLMRPVVYKSVRPALNDLNLRSLVSGTSSKGLLAHIRAGTGLTPVVETNNHPFLFGRYAFAHNGVLSHFSSLKIRLLSSLRLPEARQAILGTTDTEHMAALFFERLVGGSKDEWAALTRGKRYPVSALAATMRAVLEELESWVDQCIQEEDDGTAADTQHSALNLVVTDGSQLVATRYASPAPREPPSLYLSTVAGATLNRLYKGNPDKGHPRLQAKGHALQEGRRPKEAHGRHVIVASEPSTYDRSEWELIPAQSMVVVGDDYVPFVDLI